MFSVYCSAHYAEVLLTIRQIEAFHRAEDGGIEIAWRCWCGRRGRSPATPPGLTPPALLHAS